jgi:hypothetical protein
MFMSQMLFMSIIAVALLVLYEDGQPGRMRQQNARMWKISEFYWTDHGDGRGCA